MQWYDIFLNTTPTEFSYLETQYGFHIRDSRGADAGASVEYVDEAMPLRTIFVAVCPTRLEFGVHISQAEEVSSCYELRLIYPEANIRASEQAIYAAHLDPSALAIEIRRLAMNFHVLAAEFLTETTIFWERVHSYRVAEEEARELQQLSSESSAAFRQQDYAAVVKLLRPVAQKLKGADMKRLEISLSRVGRT